MYIYIYICMYGVATLSRLPKTVGLFWKDRSPTYYLLRTLLHQVWRQTAQSHAFVCYYSCLLYFTTHYLQTTCTGLSANSLVTRLSILLLLLTYYYYLLLTTCTGLSANSSVYAFPCYYSYLLTTTTYYFLLTTTTYYLLLTYYLYRSDSKQLSHTPVDALIIQR